MVAIIAGVVALCAMSGPGYARPVPPPDVPPATDELIQLDRLAVALRHELRTEEQRLVTECDFAGARDHSVLVRDAALNAMQDLGRLWRMGRLRSGALAMTEALTRDFLAVIYEAQGAAAIAQELVWAEQRVRLTGLRRQGDAPIEDVPSSAVACLRRALQEPARSPVDPHGPSGGRVR
jgi:hypothetical protein